MRLRPYLILAGIAVMLVPLAGLTSPALADNPYAVTVTVDANAGVHAIRPDIYGLNNASSSAIQDINATVDRWGGNRRSTYNWQLPNGQTGDASNGVRDYLFENSGDGCNTPSCSVDSQIDGDSAAGAASYITIPTIGWVSKDTTSCSFPRATYPNQTDFDGDCGSGLSDPDTPITGADPNTAYMPATPAYMKGWVQHLVNTFGTADNGGVKYYGMDNEPGIWDYDHFDIVHQPLTYDGEYNEIESYASMVKSVDPSALVAGPTDTLYDHFFDSASDLESGTTTDQDNHGGLPLDAWLLQQIHQHDTQAGLRTLDVFDLHWYPQGDCIYDNENGVCSPTSATTNACRLQETRALWDSTFDDNVCNSWVGQQADPNPNLIPRMQGWVNTYYPGTKVGLGEWNFGADDTVNGALAIADTLGIFGQQGLDYASYWETPGPAGALAFKMYRNYDGADSTFGDTSIKATSSNTNELMSFGSLRSATGQLLLMLVNEDPNNTANATINLSHFSPAGNIGVYRYSSANTNAIQHLADVSPAGLQPMSLPPYSITLLVMSPSTATITYPSPSASGIGATGATVHATVNPNGALTDCHFDYGTSTAYGSTAPCNGALPNGNTNQAVSATLSSLTPDTTYHFRLSVSKGAGPITGADQQFITSFALARGWNAISVPTNASYTAGSLIGEVGASAQAAATFSSGRFHLYVPGYSPSLSLQSYVGVFLLMNATGTWHPSGSPLAAAPASIHLNAGWQFIAEPYPSVHTPQTIANQIGPAGCANAGSVTQCTMSELAAFGGGAYSIYTPPGSSSIPLHTGDGFFVRLRQPVSWTP